MFLNAIVAVGVTSIVSERDMDLVFSTLHDFEAGHSGVMPSFLREYRLAAP